jgi:xylulokinase
MSLVIGLDVGTQSSKGVLVEAGGKVVAVASAPHDVSFPAPAWAEQNPHDWTAAVATIIGRLTSAAGRRASDISHIGVDAQVDGVVATDENLRPLHPAIIWMDRRATENTAHIQNTIGSEEVFRITGLNCDSSHGAPKMAWLIGRISDSIRWMLPPASYVTSWLTGEVAQDHANASSSMLWNVAVRQWSAVMLEAAGIEEALLPPVLESIDEIGEIHRELAERLGLLPGCRVITGSGDDHAAAVGAGAVAPGIIADVTGTAEPIGAPSDQPMFDTIDHLVETHAHAVPGQWFIENPGFVSGGSTRWLADLLGVEQSEVFELAGQATPGSKGLIFIPALSGSMTPRWNDLARGSFTGATMEHGRVEFCRAVLEGCAYALRDVIDRISELGLPSSDLRVTGGGSRSPLWLQIKADVTRRAVRPVMGEGTALGAACLAAVAAGWFPNLGAATRAVVKLGDPVAPDPTAREVYEESYRNYRSTFDALEPTYGPG